MLAWSVSLNPTGGNYAATGGSGNVTIRSIQPDAFGDHLATLSTGRNKFGMYCLHVCVHLFQCQSSSSFTGCDLMRLAFDHVRALMVHEWPCPQKVVKYTSSTSNPILSRRRIHLMQCQYARCLGLPIARFVPYLIIVVIDLQSSSSSRTEYSPAVVALIRVRGQESHLA